MPLVGFKGTAAVNAFGFLSSKRLFFVTFPAGVSTWQAPPNTFSIVSAVGKGEDGTAGFWGSAVYPSVGVGPLCGGTSYGGTLLWSTVLGKLDDLVTDANSVTTNPAGSSNNIALSYSYIWCSTSNEWQTISFAPTTSLRRRVGTVAHSYTNSGTVPTSTSTNLVANSGGYLEVYNSATTGSNTTAFGRVFPGGVGVPAVETTFNNFSITPGTNYSITNRGALTISYFA